MPEETGKPGLDSKYELQGRIRIDSRLVVPIVEEFINDNPQQLDKNCIANLITRTFNVNVLKNGRHMTGTELNRNLESYKAIERDSIEKIMEDHLSKPMTKAAKIFLKACREVYAENDKNSQICK